MSFKYLIQFNQKIFHFNSHPLHTQFVLKPLYRFPCQQPFSQHQLHGWNENLPTHIYSSTTTTGVATSSSSCHQLEVYLFTFFSFFNFRNEIQPYKRKHLEHDNSLWGVLHTFTFTYTYDGCEGRRTGWFVYAGIFTLKCMIVYISYYIYVLVQVEGLGVRVSSTRSQHKNRATYHTWNTSSGELQ